MKLVVAYCNLHPKTAAAVWNSVDEIDDVHWADTSSSDSSYYELLRNCWSERETFVLLEQDKIPDQRALRDLYDCSEPWCTYPVPMAHNGAPCDFCSLSCTKFGAELITAAPSLMEIVGGRDFGYGAKHWNRLDMAMALECSRALGRMSRKPQVHWHEAGRIGHEHQATGVPA